MKTDNGGSQAKPLPFWQRTFSSLRYRNFRLFWLGSVTEHIGEHMQRMAMAWLMKELTQSPIWLGYLVVAGAAPVLLAALVGGVVTDRVDRRKLLIGCLLGQGAVSVVLFILVATGAIVPWHLLVGTALGSILIGFNHPARAAIIPNVTPKEEWMNAIALDSISVRLAGPVVALIAGWTIASFDTAPLFAARAVGMVLATLWLLMARVPPTPASSRKQTPWHNLGEGLKYAVSSSLVMALLMVFALREFQQEMSGVLMPFFAEDILHSGASGYGYLSSASGVGSLVGLFGIATIGNFRHKGWLIAVAGILTGILLSFFAISHWLILSLVLLMAATSFGTIFENVSRTAIQTMVPDEMRGRVMGVREAIRGLFGPWVAYGLGLGGEYLGVTIAALLLGLFLIACFSLLILLLPSLRKL